MLLFMLLTRRVHGRVTRVSRFLNVINLRLRRDASVVAQATKAVDLTLSELTDL